MVLQSWGLFSRQCSALDGAKVAGNGEEDIVLREPCGPEKQSLVHDFVKLVARVKRVYIVFQVLAIAVNQRIIDTSAGRVSEADCGKAEAPYIPRSLFFSNVLKCWWVLCRDHGQCLPCKGPVVCRIMPSLLTCLCAGAAALVLADPSAIKCKLNRYRDTPDLQLKELGRMN